MKEQLLKNYFQTPFKIQPILKQKNIINIGFQNGPYVEILGSTNLNYKVSFFDTSNGSLVHSTIINNKMWTSCSVKYYVPWKIKIESESSYDEINLNLKNQIGRAHV